METKGERGPSRPGIDKGFRAWYESCPCCLTEAHPEVKAALDAEGGHGTVARDPGHTTRHSQDP